MLRLIGRFSAMGTVLCTSVLAAGPVAAAETPPNTYLVMQARFMPWDVFTRTRYDRPDLERAAYKKKTVTSSKEMTELSALISSGQSTEFRPVSRMNLRFHAEVRKGDVLMLEYVADRFAVCETTSETCYENSEEMRAGIAEFMGHDERQN
ncbi:hypothetical protein [Henriciella litoralis]|uniref:hypothetical protein n=1 Tax=Henriciella litoralis TaxID=568102 RepID=UPI00111BFFB2|nr:hypothetical protein [Henriciella litoralis]